MVKGTDVTDRLSFILTARLNTGEAGKEQNLFPRLRGDRSLAHSPFWVVVVYDDYALARAIENGTMTEVMCND